MTNRDETAIDAEPAGPLRIERAAVEQVRAMCDELLGDDAADARLARSEAEGQAQRDRQQLQFLHALLAISAKADLGGELMLRSDGQQIHAAVNVSDVFAWGCADAEDVTPETLPLLEQAYLDLRAIDRREDMYTADLYAARVRGMRPQGAAYPKGRAATQALFDACGPEREIGLGNPRKPPVPEDAP